MEGLSTFQWLLRCNRLEKCQRNQYLTTMPQHHVQLLRKPIHQRAIFTKKHRYRQGCRTQNSFGNVR